LTELVGPFGPAREPVERSKLLELGLRALASRAESQGRASAAAAMYAELPDGDFFAQLGRGRCLRAMGDLEGAVPLLAKAAAHEDHAVSARALRFTLPSMGVGVGLGALGRFPPSLEPTALLCATLVELGRNGEAAALLGAVRDPVLAAALGETLDFGPDVAPEVRQALAGLGGSR